MKEMTNLIMIEKLKQRASYFFENFIKMRKKKTITKITKRSCKLQT